MKIDNDRLAGTGSPAVRTGEVDRSQRPDRYRQSEAADYGSPDHVEIGGLADSIVRACQSEAADHSARVQALKAAYQSGRLVVDPQQLSHKMVASWLAGGAAPKE